MHSAAPGQGQGLDVREHQFVAATDNVDYSFERIKGVQNMVLGGSGFFMDKFRATNGDAMVWLHGHGNVFLVDARRGRAARRGGGLVALQGSHGEPRSEDDGLKSGMFGGGGKLTWNRFTGPGSLAIQTMFIAPVEGEGPNGSNASAAATGGIAGALIGG